MGGIEASEVCTPERSELFVHGRRQAGALEFAEKLLFRAVRESHVGGEKLLVENGRPEESRDLLFFHRVARQRHHMPDTGKNEAGDAAFKGLEEGDLPVLEGQHGVGFPEFDAVLGGNRVDVLRIDRQGIEGRKELARGRIRCAADRREKNPENHQEETKPHEKSVDTFGMGEQGGRRTSPRGVTINGCPV